MNNAIKEQLIQMADQDYKKFASALIPNIDNMLGVRLPKLRKLAQQLAKNEWRSYLAEAESDYFEEVMLQGMIIGYVKSDIEVVLEAAADFVPKINNWSVCDSFCAGLKMTKAN